MAEWWASLTGFQQVMFGIASGATLLLIVFLILLLFGVGDESYDGDVDSDFDFDDADGINDEPSSAMGGLRLFTLRNALAFLSIGGWVAFGFNFNMAWYWAMLLGILFGALAAVLQSIVMKLIYRLESDGSLDYRNAIGKTGSVYIKIPKNHQGSGKVNITFQERYIEAEAVTNESEDLTSNTPVEVIDIEDDHILVVKKIQS